MNNPYILLVLTTAFWGANAIAGRLAIGHIDPQMLTMWRWLGTVLVIALFARKHIVRDFSVFRHEWWRFAVLGTLGYAGFNLLLYGGLTQTTALNAAVIQATIPVLVAVLSALVFKNHLKFGQLIALAIALSGVIYTVTKGQLMALASSELNSGDVLILISSLFYAFYSVGLHWRPKVHVISFLFYAGIFAFLVASIAVIINTQQTGWQWPTVRGWGIVLFTILLPSITSQVFYIMGVEAIGPARASIFINLIPVFSAIFAILLLGEQFKIYHAIGFIFVAIGILLNERLISRT